jgi:C1A family cysteine protease
MQGQCAIKKADPNHRSLGRTFVAPPPAGVNVNAFEPCLKGDCSQQLKWEADMMFGVKSKGPFIAYVDASNWQHYASGIYPPDKCSQTADASNHVVQLLGYGHENGIPYWLIKNSWGQEWGENGYIKLPMGVNACGIANYVLKAEA